MATTTARTLDNLVDETTGLLRTNGERAITAQSLREFAAASLSEYAYAYSTAARTFSWTTTHALSMTSDVAWGSSGSLTWNSTARRPYLWTPGVYLLWFGITVRPQDTAAHSLRFFVSPIPTSGRFAGWLQWPSEAGGHRYKTILSTGLYRHTSSVISVIPYGTAYAGGAVTVDVAHMNWGAVRLS